MVFVFLFCYVFDVLIFVNSLHANNLPTFCFPHFQDLKRDPAYGTDVLRLWAASSEYTKDISIGKTILAQVAESLRKFRATARFMLGNLNGFKAENMVPYKDLGVLERIMLVEVFDFMQGVDAAYDSFTFNKVYGLLQYFSSSSLSAFYLDVAKDTLYSELKDAPKRLAVQTVLFHVSVPHSRFLGTVPLWMNSYCNA